MQLNSQQLAAIENPLSIRHALVLAGAGSGKTTVISERVKFLISEGVQPEKVLVITFTNRAGRELKKRLKGTIGSSSSKVWAGTFHSFCLFVMRSHMKEFGLRGIQVLDRDDSDSAIALLRSKVIEPGSEFPSSLQLLEWFSYSANAQVPLEHYLSDVIGLPIESAQKALSIHAKYLVYKRVRKYMDFDDILLHFVTTLKDKPDLLITCQAKFRHILVDEFQDSNPLQYLLVKLLAGSGNHLFAVGDDCQSIYAFRAAKFEHVHQFADFFPGSKTYPLNQNYRSTQPILDISNWLLANSPLDYKKHLISRTPEDDTKPKLLDFYDQESESIWIAEDIASHIKAGQPPGEIMILVRSYFSGRSIEAELIKSKISYQFIGGQSLLKSAHVKDVVCTLRLINNLSDEISWVRFLRLFPGVGDIKCQQIIQKIEIALNMDGNTKYNIINTLKGFPKVNAGLLGKISDLLDTPSSPVEAAQYVIDLLSSTLKRKYDRWGTRVRDLHLIVKLAGRHKSLQAFVEAFTIEPMHSSQLDGNGKQVKLITVHSAKGMEANICYFTQAQLGNYPNPKSWGDLSKEEEERRVAYVGLTRARHRLTITRSTPSANQDVVLNKTAGQSYFFANLPTELIDENPESNPLDGHAADNTTKETVFTL
ncbi:ATP-dependent helicase [Neptuniibacter sp. QD37_11]|uniref:ATP-dependent helicase n=1 Tax=Neptuniibacter sp. QD37_11 TaxID=3398209 RepID=UPI0039F63059